MSNSPPTVTDQITQQTQTEHAWDLPGLVPDKLAGCDYGYVSAGKVIGCSAEELQREFEFRGPDGIKFVWTPETSQPVFPEKVSLLVNAFRKIAVKKAWQSIFWGVGLVVFGLVLALAFQDWRYFYLNIFSIFGAMMLFESTWQLMRARHYTQEEAEADASSLRFDAWIKKKKISGYTFALAALIVLVGAFQVLSGGESITRAGLVKQAVWDGQLWRLFTACLMHGSWMHFWMNFLVLLHFGKIVEQTSRRRALIPLIFLVSGTMGSIFSVLLYPHSTSVGASGGLMGLLGFITTAAHFDERRYPPKYLRNSIETIVMIGMFGLVGFAFVDNAAHLGGLCGGLLLGWLLLRPYNQESDARRTEGQLTIVGITALVIVALIALMAIVKIWG